MKRILYFTKYSEMGASSRLRSYQFFPFLIDKGYLVAVSPFFDDNYLRFLYEKKKLQKFIFAIIAYVKRFFNLFKIFKYDIILIEKELFPYMPAWFEVIMNKIDIKYFVDYDDAIFHNYDLSSNYLIRSLLSNKIDKVMRNSKCVFAGNSYLSNRALSAGATKVVILPTVIDLKRYFVKEKNIGSLFILGWIGSPSTFKYIEDLFPVFKKLHDKYPEFIVNIIGAKQDEKIEYDFIHFIPWSESTEVDEINKFDLGIMPLDNTPWELGKCSYKLIQYMGCGKAVLASPVGMNHDVVQNGTNGYLVDDDEWFDKISYYIENRNLSIQHGTEGRYLVDSKYNLQANLNIILKEIEN